MDKPLPAPRQWRMADDRTQALEALRRLELQILKYQRQGPWGPSDPLRSEWERQVEMLREEASALRVQLYVDALQQA